MRKTRSNTLPYGRMRTYLNKTDVTEARKMLDEGVPKAVVAQRFGVAEFTLDKRLGLNYQ